MCYSCLSQTPLQVYREVYRYSGCDSMLTGVSGTMPGEDVIYDRCISGIPARVLQGLLV